MPCTGQQAEQSKKLLIFMRALLEVVIE